MKVSKADDNANALILNLLREVIPWQFAKKEIRPEMSLQHELGVDSLGKLALAFRLEEKFGVDLSDFSSDINSIRTVGDVLEVAKDLIERTEGA